MTRIITSCTIITLLLAFFVVGHAGAVPTASRPAPYPDYHVGGVGTLIVTTNPPQSDATVYMWRTKNGEPEGPQPTPVGVTDAQGRFAIEDLPIATHHVGTYTNERYAVGSATGPKSNALNFDIHAAGAPIVNRPAPFPNYLVGSTGTLSILTVPALPDQPIYRWRTKNGQPDGLQPFVIGQTDGDGRYLLTIEVTPNTVGTYTNERYAVGTAGGPRSSGLNFTITDTNPPTVVRSAPFPNYRVGDSGTLTITTNPQQRYAKIYRWRAKNGQPDGQQPEQVGVTDGAGRYSVTVDVTPNTVGVYTGEQYAVGGVHSHRSPAVDYVVDAASPPIVHRPPPFPDYLVGGAGTLTITTDPVQADQPIYFWRTKDGQPDGPQGIQVATTDPSGRYALTIDITPNTVGTYTDERYAVGTVSSPHSPGLDFTIAEPPQPPIVVRPAPFPTYEVGDSATLTIITDPPQPDAPIYLWRMKDGQPDGPQGAQVATTGPDGRYTLTLEVTPNTVGIYTDEQYAVGDVSNPRSPALDFTISAPPVGPLEIDELSPRIFGVDRITTVTVHGRGFTPDTLVRVEDLAGGTELDPRRFVPDVATTAEVISVSPDGKQMQVEIDTQGSMIEEAFNFLVVDNGAEESASPFRVVGEGVVVDAMSPPRPWLNDAFVFALSGSNLADATVTAPPGIDIEIQSRQDDRITGLLIVRSGTLPGPRTLTVEGGGRTLDVAFEVVFPPPPGRVASNVLDSGVHTVDVFEGTDVARQARAAGEAVPKLLFQGMRGEPGLLESIEGAKELASNRGFCFLEVTGRWPLFEEQFEIVFPFNRATGRFGTIAANLGLGNSINVTALVVSISARVDLTFNFGYCPLSGSFFAFCFEADLRFTVPGLEVNRIFTSCFSSSFEQDLPPDGNTTRIEYVGGACATADNDVVQPGGIETVLTQVRCCEQAFSLEAEGVAFGSSFALDVPNAAVTTPLECVPPEGDFRLFLDVDDDNPFSTAKPASIDELDDLNRYLPGSNLDGTSVPDLLNNPQSMKLVAAYVVVENGQVLVVPPPKSVSNVQFDLAETSAFAGVASNWPVDNPSMDPDFYFVGGPSSNSATVAFGDDFTARVELVAGDYGGFTKVSALPSGLRASTDIRIPIPVDAAAGKFLPDAGWRPNGGMPVNTGNLDSAADLDADPITASANPPLGALGDGLSAYEEYRGFVTLQSHVRTNPDRKDLFISSNMPSDLAYASPNLPLDVHELDGPDGGGDDEYDADRVINFNAGNGGFGGPVPGFTRQKAIRSRLRQRPPSNIDQCAAGAKFPLANRTNVNDTEKVEVYRRTFSNDTCLNGVNLNGAQIQREMKRTFGHEVGHGLHICHRPDASCLDPVGTNTTIMSSGLAIGANNVDDPESQYNALDVDQIRIHGNF